MNSHVSSSPDLESILESFDAACSSGQDVDLAEFLPAASHPQYAEILVELARSDIEFRWQANRRRLDDYRTLFPFFVENKNALQAIAFEEYRLRWIDGEQLDPEEYCQRFGIDVSSWPIWTDRNQRPATDSSQQENADVSGLSGELRSALRSIGRSAAASRFPKIGEKFLDFEVVGELGEGAFGRVFLARQGDLAHRLVALKVALEDSDEPQHLAQLQHTNIMPIYSLHRVGSLEAVCMPFLGLTTLDDVLKCLKNQKAWSGNGQQLISTVAAERCETVKQTIGEREGYEETWLGDRNGARTEHFEQLKEMGLTETALWVISRVADGLAHAHRQGIVHNDLKPANILLGDNGQPLVLDFHLAQSRKLTNTSQLIGGTLPYMSAEHLRTLSGKGTIIDTVACDHRSDVFSLGVILFELLTGKLPFPIRSGDMETAVRQMVVDRRQAVNLREHRHDISPAIAAIVGKCLHFDPGQRYQSADALHGDIERHLANLPLTHAPNTSLKERLVKWSKRHPRVASTGTALVAASLLITLLVFSLLARGRQLAGLQARQWQGEVLARLEQTALPLTGIDLDRKTIERLQKQAEELLEQEQISDWLQFAQGKTFKMLPDDLQLQLRNETGQMNYLLANSLRELALAERDSELRDEELNAALRHNEQAELCFAGQNRRAVLLQKADLLADMGQKRIAEELREEAESVPAAGIHDRFLMALQYRQQHDEAAAQELLKQNAAENHADYKVWMLLGHSSAAQQQSERAEAYYSICISLEPELPWAYLQRGELYLRTRQFQHALADYDLVLKKRPDDRTALANRGLVYQQLSDWQKAERDLTAVIELGTSQTRVYFARANVRSILGDEQGAAADFETGMELSPQDELSWLARGAAKIKNSPEDALVDFDAALRINPKSKVALNNRAAVLSEYLDRTDEAIECLTILLESYPTDATSFASRGVLLARIGDRDRAHDDARKAIQLKSDADTLYRVAGVYALTSQIEEADRDKAIRLLAHAIWLDPGLVAKSIYTDSDLKDLRETKPFQAIVAMLNEIRRLGYPPLEKTN